MTFTVLTTIQTQYSIYSISHQKAVAEHWDLPNTEIFQSHDVASVFVIEIFVTRNNFVKLIPDRGRYGVNMS
jgi:ABC-type anion transport system duplicated permease subunit